MLFWGLSYECNLYWANTWPLEVVARWFWKSNRVCEIVDRINEFKNFSSSVLSDEFCSLGTNMDCGLY